MRVESKMPNKLLFALVAGTEEKKKSNKWYAVRAYSDVDILDFIQWKITDLLGVKHPTSKASMCQVLNYLLKSHPSSIEVRDKVIYVHKTTLKRYLKKAFHASKW